MPALTLDKSKTALLIMDVQNDQVRRIQETGQKPDLFPGELSIDEKRGKHDATRQSVRQRN